MRESQTNQECKVHQRVNRGSPDSVAFGQTHAVRARSRDKWKNLAGIVLLPLLLYAMLRWFEHKQVYHPTREWIETGRALGRPWEDLRLQTADGVELSAWFFAANTNSPRSHLASVICHGNGGNISHRLDLCEALLGTGVAVLAFDYRGYGKSAGRPGEEGTYLDAQAAHAWLRKRGFAGSNIIAFGESLGGAVAAELARREPLGGLILQSTFTSIPDIGAELFPWLPVRWIASIRYDTRRKLPELGVPLLIMHSRADRLIPFHHAEANFAAARDPKRLWEIAGDHNDPLDADHAGFVNGVETLLTETFPGAVLPEPGCQTPRGSMKHPG